MEIITNYIINVLYKFQTIDYGDKLRASMCMCVRVIFAAVIVETPAGFRGNIFFTPRRRWSLSFIYISSRTQRVYYFYFSSKSFYRSESISYDDVFAVVMNKCIIEIVSRGPHARVVSSSLKNFAYRQTVFDRGVIKW